MTQLQVPFFRPSIGDEEIERVVECLRSGWLTTGPNTTAFETEFAKVMGGEYEAIAVNSATAALHLGLDALGVGPGDEVIVPTLTFTATAEVVRYMGARPVFVDIDPETLCLDIAKTAEAITPNTKTIMPVHFAGRPCDMTALSTLADTHNLTILDDAAHALPAHHQGDLIGAAGADVTAFSFYANKTMTTGEGGMLVTRNQEIAERARVMRLHGIDRDVFNRFSDNQAGWIYDVVAPGYKYNMTDIAAAMGRVQLSKINRFHIQRTELAARYDVAFNDMPLTCPPHAAAGDKHSWHLYIIQLTNEALVSRNEFIDQLKAAGIGCSVHYRPLHQMTYWAKDLHNQSFPHADAYFGNCVSLPLFMDMTKAEQDYVIQTVKSILTK